MSSRSDPGRAPPTSGRTAWARSLETPLREFLRTETGGAGGPAGGDGRCARLGERRRVVVRARSGARRSRSTSAASGIALDLREWVNSGLMTFFFFVVGLEARREFDLGELRERRRFALPLLAGIGGMAVAVAIYLAFNAGRSSAHGWGIAMSTDTAFALGLLALVGPRFPDRLRAFMLTVVVVDDIVALVVIATVYTETLRCRAAARGRRLLRQPCSSPRSLRVGPGLVCAVLGAARLGGAAQVRSRAGRDRPRDGPARLRLPGSAVQTSSARRSGSASSASNRLRIWRARPGSRSGRRRRSNERLQQLFHPWTSYVIVPLFALANAGIAIDGELLARAFTSPITLGILFGYVVGKPVGILGCSWLVTRLSRGRLRPPVGWVAVAGGGTIAGIGFTVALLVATLAFDGRRLEEAKLGILGAAARRGARHLAAVPRHGAAAPAPANPRPARNRASRSSTSTVDVDPERDHVRGPDRGAR